MKYESTGFRKTTGKAGRDRPGGVAKAVARRQKEEQRRRVERKARLKRRGVFAALGIAAMLAIILLIAHSNKPAAKPAATNRVNVKDTVASNTSKVKPRGVGVESKIRQVDGVQRSTLPQEELIASLPKFADISDEQLVYPKQMPSGIAPDSFKPVMVATTSGANSVEDEKQVMNMAIQRGLIAARIENTKYAFYAPDNHPFYRKPSAK